MKDKPDKRALRLKDFALRYANQEVPAKVVQDLVSEVSGADGKPDMSIPGLLEVYDIAGPFIRCALANKPVTIKGLRP